VSRVPRARGRAAAFKLFRWRLWSIPWPRPRLYLSALIARSGGRRQQKNICEFAGRLLAQRELSRLGELDHLPGIQAEGLETGETGNNIVPGAMTGSHDLHPKLLQLRDRKLDAFLGGTEQVQATEHCIDGLAST